MRDPMRRRASLGLVAATLLATLPAAALPGAALAFTPVDGGAFVSFSTVDINIGAGDQYDPHVSGDLVSYTSNSAVRYYDFYTGDDDAVPVDAGKEDQLSDVANGRIVFTRFDPLTFEAVIMVFDTSLLTTFEVDPQTDQQRSNSAMGGDTVAFTDLFDTSLHAARLGVPGSIKVTNDTRINRQPQVAPSGGLIVYESCALLASNCDVWQATWSGSSWLATALTDNSEPESDPDTDGGVVVYAGNRSGEQDIYWQPVGGGVEQHLDLAGLQRNPSVSAGVIFFESVEPGQFAADTYLYEIATNRLFQVTSTPLNEHLNDLDVLPDGRVRVVWSSGSEGTRDVYGVTLELPPAGPDYDFGGFQAPVEERPTFNSMKAGAAVPVKFSLGGDEGLAIFASGYPRSQTIACDSTADVDPIEQTVSAGGSSLTFDPATGLYTYVWKTDKTWAGTCRQLVLGFADGTFARANFKFK